MGMFTANHPCCSTYQHSAELGHHWPGGHGQKEGCDPWQIGKSLPPPNLIVPLNKNQTLGSLLPLEIPLVGLVLILLGAWLPSGLLVEIQPGLVVTSKGSVI